MLLGVGGQCSIQFCHGSGVLHFGDFGISLNEAGLCRFLRGVSLSQSGLCRFLRGGFLVVIRLKLLDISFLLCDVSFQLASMMALIQQITLLLRISAAPNTVEEYDSPNTPVKIRKVCDMVGEWKDEIVVIGVRHKNVVEAYANEIRRRFPDRKLFVVTGSTTTLAGRRKLKNTLKESGNGILLCTQQCLPSSVNFEFVNKVIIPELHYNNARMSQFYMRFVRFTSTDWKDIYFVTYSGSIESNQMQMVLAKERLNLFMKGQDVDLDEVYDRFGVDYDLMSLLMSREADEDGNFKISWGEQKIS